MNPTPPEIQRPRTPEEISKNINAQLRTFRESVNQIGTGTPPRMPPQTLSIEQIGRAVVEAQNLPRETTDPILNLLNAITGRPLINVQDAQHLQTHTITTDAEKTRVLRELDRYLGPQLSPAAPSAPAPQPPRNPEIENARKEVHDKLAALRKTIMAQQQTKTGLNTIARPELQAVSKSVANLLTVQARPGVNPTEFNTAWTDVLDHLDAHFRLVYDPRNPGQIVQDILGVNLENQQLRDRLQNLSQSITGAVRPTNVPIDMGASRMTMRMGTGVEQYVRYMFRKMNRPEDEAQISAMVTMITETLANMLMTVSDNAVSNSALRPLFGPLIDNARATAKGMHWAVALRREMQRRIDQGIVSPTVLAGLIGTPNAASTFMRRQAATERALNMEGVLRELRLPEGTEGRWSRCYGEWANAVRAGRRGTPMPTIEQMMRAGSDDVYLAQLNKAAAEANQNNANLTPQQTEANALTTFFTASSSVPITGPEEPTKFLIVGGKTIRCFKNTEGFHLKISVAGQPDRVIVIQAPVRGTSLLQLALVNPAGNTNSGNVMVKINNQAGAGVSLNLLIAQMQGNNHNRLILSANPTQASDIQSERTA